MLLIVAVIVVCFSLINLVNTTITNFLSRRQEIGMLQSIGLSKNSLSKCCAMRG
ncbi:MAG: FtsX-like permease family protein [Ruminococcus sp.]